jgi:hypothetical protein
MVGIVDEEKNHPMNLSIEETGMSTADKSTALRNRLLKLKEKSDGPKQNKKPMCYYAI